MEAMLSNILKRNNEIIEQKGKWLKVLAVVGIIAVAAGVAYAIYSHYKNTCCNEYENEFDDDVVEEFFEED